MTVTMFHFVSMQSKDKAMTIKKENKQKRRLEQKDIN